MVREPRVPYGAHSGNGEAFQSFVVRELKAVRREQDTINRRLLLLITSVADGVEKLSRRLDRQDRINRLILREFKRLRRRCG
jgi:hypothetical protein